MNYNKTGPWHLREKLIGYDTVCGVRLVPETRSITYEYFVNLPEEIQCQECANHEDLPFILLRTRA